MKNLHLLVRKQTKQIKGLEERLNCHIQSCGIKVTENVHEELSALMQKYSDVNCHYKLWRGQILINILDTTDEIHLSEEKIQIKLQPITIRWAVYLATL